MIALFVVLLFLPQDRLRGATVARTRERFRMPSLRNAVVAAVALVVGMWLRGRCWRRRPSTTWASRCARP